MPNKDVGFVHIDEDKAEFVIEEMEGTSFNNGNIYKNSYSPFSTIVSDFWSSGQVSIKYPRSEIIQGTDTIDGNLSSTSEKSDTIYENGL